jgi:hypothetical protein
METQKNEIMKTSMEGESFTKVFNPMERFYLFARVLDYNYRGETYDRRGDFITVYLSLDELIFYQNLIKDSDGELYNLRHKYYELGYPKMTFILK